MNKISLTRALGCCIALVAAMATPSLWAGPEQMTSVDKNPVVQPVVAPECNWTGFYLGLNAGYGWGNSRSSSNDEGFDESSGSVSLDPDGAVVGGQLGFNWQIGHFVLGLEGKGGWLDFDDSRFIVESPPDNFATVNYDWYAMITPRVGVSLWNNRLLLYGKGGVAFVDIRNRAGDLQDPGGDIDLTSNSSKDDTEIGWTVGGGFEVALNCHWSVGVEYDYLGDLDRGSSNFDEDVGQEEHFHHDNDAHLATARVNYKFWGGR